MKNLYKLSLSLTALSLTSLGHAGLKNISATTLQSTQETAIACTIIENGGATYKGYKVLVGLSEAVSASGNPQI